jgi:transcriptional regulator with GAF, ATPase, and Fis domain
MGALELLPGSKLGAELNGVTSFAEHDADTVIPPPMPDQGRRAEPDTLRGIRDAHAEAEREQILRVLTHVHGNVAKTSRVLGLSRSAVIRRMQKYGIASYKGLK